MVLVMPFESTDESSSNLYDIDNVVAIDDKQIIGFIYELVGPVSHPLYSIQLYPSYIESVKSQNNNDNDQTTPFDFRNHFHGKRISLVKRYLKVIGHKLDHILRKKGCDASNLYDEELSDKE